jgi:hypothetical protein
MTIMCLFQQCIWQQNCQWKTSPLGSVLWYYDFRNSFGIYSCDLHSYDFHGRQIFVPNLTLNVRWPSSLSQFAKKHSFPVDPSVISSLRVDALREIVGGFSVAPKELYRKQLGCYQLPSRYHNHGRN